MNVIILGPPGSGKGTQSKILAEKYGITHLSTGDLLRKEMEMGTELGKSIAELMNSGRYVSDEIMISLVRQKIKTNKTKGIVFDGFPRTVEQAEFLKEEIFINYVVVLHVDEDSLIERMVERGKASETPRPEDLDRNVIKVRLNKYNESTFLLKEHYLKDKTLNCIFVDGNDSIEDVSDIITSNMLFSIKNFI